MKAISTLIFASLFTLAAASTPVGKVLELLTTLEGKIAAEGEAATTSYEEYSAWCEDTSKELEFNIKTGKTKAEGLKALIEKESSTISSLTAKVDELAASLAQSEADLKAATDIRKSEAADFAASEKELAEVIDTLERAINILEREGKGAAMLQLKNAGSITGALQALVHASALSSADATRLTALVQSSQESDDDESDLGAPAAATYESHSGNIIETLEDLLEKAQSQLTDSRKKEIDASHNFEMLRQSLEDQIKYSGKDMSDAKKSMAESANSKATAEGDLATTSSGVDEDAKSVAQVKANCMGKAQDYEAAKKSRGEELKALAEAKKVISESTVGAETLSYSQAQVSFLQVARTKLASRVDLANFEAVRFVRELARKQNSKALAQLASRMASAMRQSTGTADDPFAKVKGLISSMINKLEGEMSADASHKAYCDKELAESEASKAEKNADAEKLLTKIDQLSARSAQAKEETSALQKGLAELAASQAEATKMRQDESAAFVKNKADMEQGLEGVKMGLKILREYYASTEKEHSEAEGAGTTIVGLLEVVESDFSKGLAEMITTEESAAAAYEKLTKENEIEKATKETSVKHLSKESTDLDTSIAEYKSDSASVEAELDSITEYLGKLEEMCVAKPDTYEERKSRRAAEIEGLKQALQILEGEVVLLQGKRTLRGVRRHF